MRVDVESVADEAEVSRYERSAQKKRSYILWSCEVKRTLGGQSHEEVATEGHLLV